MRPLLPRLAFLLVALTGSAHAQQTVNDALAQEEWDTAIALAKATPAEALEAQAKPFAERGVVPAMWLMGAARFEQNQKASSATWFYKGWIGLQMDLSLCRLTSSRAVTNLLMDAFPDALTSIRNDMALRTQGIQKASNYYQSDDRREDPLPGWSCRWAAGEWHTKPLIVAKSRFKDQRAKAFQTFLIKTGQAPKSPLPFTSSNVLQP